MNREEIAEVQRVLHLSSLTKADVVAPVKLPRCVVEWIKRRKGPVSTYLRHLVIEELRKMVDGSDE